MTSISTDAYVELKENQQGYTHLALYSNPDSTNPVWLTTGPWEVTKLDCVDRNNRVLYYTSTERGSMQRHVYRINMDGNAKTIISPLHLATDLPHFKLPTSIPMNASTAYYECNHVF